jgi:hypothetical protein
MTVAAWAAFGLAAVPLLLIVCNLHVFRPPPRVTRSLVPREVSVLIPARNEAERIRAAIESVLASAGDAEIEVLVLDDDSTDGTARIVAAIAARDSRVILLERRGGPLRGWGKPLACAEMADRARGRVLIFMDADVRLEADAVARIAAALDDSNAALLSGVPRQITVGFAERLIVPLIHFVLLGFLPLLAMRRLRKPAFGAACGQLLAVERDAYFACGGHRAVADRIHDALALARRFRKAGFTTDLADFTPLAHCRLYRDSREVLAGFAKNAHEGLGSPAGIVPWTVILLGGQAAWTIPLPSALLAGESSLSLPLLLAGAASLTSRALVARRFEPTVVQALLHPLGVAGLIAIQWYGAARRLLGRPVAWKERIAGGGGETCAAHAEPRPGKRRARALEVRKLFRP